MLAGIFVLVVASVVVASTKVWNHTPYNIKVIISGGAFPHTEWLLGPGESETKVKGIKGGLCPTDFIALIKEDGMTGYPDADAKDEDTKRLVLYTHRSAGWCGTGRDFHIWNELRPDSTFGYTYTINW